MKKHLILVGNAFIQNAPMQRYLIRSVERRLTRIDQIDFFGESDNSLFLHLEHVLSSSAMVVVIASKNAFAVVGKLISTVTSDNQVLKEGMLIPSQTSMYEDRSYLLQHRNALINVLTCEEGEALPELLLREEERSARIQIFDEEIGGAKTLLEPLAQSLDVRLSFTRLVPGWLQLDIHSRRYGNISQFIASAKQLLPQHIIAASDLAAYLIEVLSHHRRKITFAESCTGGLMAYFLTAHSGASEVFEGSLVTYSNTLKSNWLAVDDAVIERDGAVSLSTVDEMSDGALNVSYADYALAISGIAGPEGGTADKPVGTVCIGVRSKTASASECVRFRGDRNYVQEQSVLYALKMLLLLDRELFFQ